MKNIQIFILLIFITLICSCSSIRSIHKLGEEPYMLNAEEWEGTWIAGDEAYTVKVVNWQSSIFVDSTSSEIEVMSIENDKIVKHNFFIKQTGSNTYGNLVTKEKHYIFVKFKKRKNEIIIWLPNFDMMKEAIDSKKLAGVVKDKDVLLKSDEKVFNTFFTDNEDQMLFKYEEPFIFRKLIK